MKLLSRLLGGTEKGAEAVRIAKLGMGAHHGSDEGLGKEVGEVEEELLPLVVPTRLRLSRLRRLSRPDRRDGELHRAPDRRGRSEDVIRTPTDGQS